MFQHLVVVNGSYASVVDGSILTLRRMTRHLANRLDRVTVLCAPGRSDTHDCERDGAVLHTVPSLPMPFQPEYRLPAGLGRDAARMLTDTAGTLVHLGAPDPLAVAAMRHARRAGVPVVTSFHSNIVSYFRYLGLPRSIDRLGWRFFRWFYGRCDQVYVPTRSMQEELERNGVRAEYRLWPRGVDHLRFDPAKRSSRWRRRPGIADDELLVVFAARLKWEKGLKILAAVMERLNHSALGIRTMIVGDGVGRRELERRLPGTLFTGFLDAEALAAAYACADVFLYPSSTDTFGNVTLEAMASGLPVVCARAPGSKCLVRDGVNGYLVDPENVGAYVDAVQALAREPDLRRAMAAASRRLSLAYTWERAFALLEGYYAELWHDRGRRAYPIPVSANQQAYLNRA